jgi:hypothetical protein
MQKILTRVALFRRGVRQFEELVNRHLTEGWTVKTLSVNKGGLRFICLALLEKA